MGQGVRMTCKSCGYEQMLIYGPTMLTVSQPEKTHMKCKTCKAVSRVCEPECDPYWANQPKEHRCCCRAIGHKLVEWDRGCPQCGGDWDRDDSLILVD